MDESSQLRNIKDFLIIYNSLTERCFTRCVTNMNHRYPTKEETSCIHNCAERFQKGNQRFMKQFMKMTPEMVQRRNEDAMKQANKYNDVIIDKPDDAIAQN
ncbi:mitochondrial import inner membrane translocase subunit Tim10 B-like [Ciona intestinalis]